MKLLEQHLQGMGHIIFTTVKYISRIHEFQIHKSITHIMNQELQTIKYHKIKTDYRHFINYINNLI